MQKPGMSWLRLFILALAGAASLFGQITIVGGNNQFAVVGTAFGQQLQAKVGACSYNCPAVNVTFQVGSTAGYQNLYFCGTAGCTTGSSVLVQSNADGFASLPATAGAPAGSYAVTVSAPNVGSVNFTEANLPGPIETVTVETSPPGLSFTVGGAPYTAAQNFYLPQGTQITLSTTPTQYSSDKGTEYSFSGWSDGSTAPIDQIVVLASVTSHVANFSTAAYLLTVSVVGTGGSASCGSFGSNTCPAYFPAGSKQQVWASKNPGYCFVGWSGTGSGSFSFPPPGDPPVCSNGAEGFYATMNGPITETATFAPAISVTVNTSPSGLSFTADGTAYTSAQNFNWAYNTQHTIATTSPQPGAAGTQYVFANWSDGGAMSHTVTVPLSATTYTANFTTQYQLTVNGGVGGSVSPPSGYYNPSQTVTLSAVPNSGYVFTGWTGTGNGSYTGSTPGASVTMNGPIIETATFAPTTVSVTVNTFPSGLSFTADGTAYTSAQTFNWAFNTQHTIATTSPQGGAFVCNGGQCSPLNAYVFANWSDGGAMSHNVTVPSSATTYTANFTTQYWLAVTAGAGGTVGPLSGYYNSGQTVALSATPSPGYVFTGWTGTGSGSYNGTNAGGQVTMNGPITETASFVLTTGVTVATSPPGLSFTVDGTTYTTAQNFNWAYNSQHTIATTSPQPGATGTQYVFANWSDGGAMSHTVTVPSSATTYTANFTTQYQLTVNGGVGGSVSPPSGYYNASQTVTLSAVPNSGYVFSAWAGAGSGSYSGTNAGGSVTMNGPITETATFAPVTGVTVGTSPSGLSFTVDGAAYTSAQNFNWPPNSQHTIAVTSPQPGATGTQYAFANWSDTGAMSHTVTASSAGTTYTANFTTQYLLTVTAGSGGSVAPPSGWVNAGSTVFLSATAAAGYGFTGWSGEVSGTANPQPLTMNYPCNVTASFAPVAGGVPSVVSAGPALGRVAAQNFTFQFAHSAGYQNLSVLDILINNFLDGRQACYLAYVLSSNTLVLVDDPGDAGGPYAGSVVLGSQAVIQNSQCAVTLTSAAGSGNTFTLALSITFTPAFSGNKIQYLAARDGSGNNTGWQAMGVWQVPPGPSGQITVDGIQTRNAAPGGTAQSLTFSFTDLKGAGDFGVLNVLVNNFIDGRHACYLAYVAASNTLYLVDDAGDAGGPFAEYLVLNGAAGTIENSQCSVSGTGSSVSPGYTLMLTLNITFQPAFAGNRIIWAAGRDAAGGNNTDWQAMGTTTVQ